MGDKSTYIPNYSQTQCTLFVLAYLILFITKLKIFQIQMSNYT
jgi:hypothetical protein